MGIPADHETKQARRAAHASLDELRNILQLSKSRAYRWLQKMLKLSPEECHIGRFDKKMCQKVSEICDRAVSTVRIPKEADDLPKMQTR
jgi:hypothetical protein